MSRNGLTCCSRSTFIHGFAPAEEMTSSHACLLCINFNLTDFGGLLQVRLRADSLVVHAFVERRVTLLAALHVPVQIARDGEQVAFHRWLSDSFVGQPRGYEGVRSDFIRHRRIAGEGEMPN
jgi:hypothetical protein